MICSRSPRGYCSGLQAQLGAMQGCFAGSTSFYPPFYAGRSELGASRHGLCVKMCKKTTIVVSISEIPHTAAQTQLRFSGLAVLAQGENALGALVPQTKVKKRIRAVMKAET